MAQRRQNPGRALQKIEAENIDQALALLPGEDHNRAQVEAMVLACEAGDIFPNGAPPNIKVATCAYAMIWGLDAAMKEVIPFATKSKGVEKWGIYVTSDGQNTWAHKFDDYRGTTHRLLSDKERKALLIAQPLAFEVTTIREGFLPFTAYGTATNVAEVSEWNDRRKTIIVEGTTNPVEVANPTAMALARGYRRALRRAYPVNMQTADRMFSRMAAEGLSMEVASAEVIDAEAKAVPPIPVDNRWQGFWVTVKDRWDIGGDGVYDIIEERTGQSLTSGADDDGVVIRSMTEWAGTPEGALSVIEDYYADEEDEPVDVAAEPVAEPEPPAGPTGEAIHARLLERFESAQAVDTLLGASFVEDYPVVDEGVMIAITALVLPFESFLAGDGPQFTFEVLDGQLKSNELTSLLDGQLRESLFVSAWIDEVSSAVVGGGS